MSNRHKRVFQESVGFQPDDSGRSVPTPTVEFDFEKVNAAFDNARGVKDENGPTRDELRAELKKRGASDLECEIWLMRIFDGASVRKIADATGKGRSWVHTRLNRLPERQESIRPAPKESYLQLPLILARLRERTRVPCQYSTQLGKDFRENWKGTLAEKLMVWLRTCPEALLHEPDLRNALTDLLEAAHRGQCVERVPGLLPDGSPRKVSMAARKALAILAPGTKGTRFDVTLIRPSISIHQLCWRIKILRSQWNYHSAPGSKETRLKRLRMLHPNELRDFSNKEVVAMLTKGDLVVAACRLAAKATGVSWKVFHKEFGAKFSMPAA